MRRAITGLTIALSVGCSTSSSDDGGTYTIAFPSTAAAVAADNVQVLVFDATDAGASFCTDLVIARRSSQALPKALAESKVVMPCDMVAGRGELVIPYGLRAVLGVAQKGGQDYLIGCALQQVGSGDAQVPVQLALASTTLTVPATTCASLSDHCSGRCPQQ